MPLALLVDRVIPAIVTVGDIDFYRYELPLTTPLHLGGDRVERRGGLLVRLTTTDGAVGWGDAAPLPGFSTETLTEVETHARSVGERWSDEHLPRSGGSFDQKVRTLTEDEHWPASLRFAMETAVVALLASACGRSISAVLGAPRATVELNALIPDLLDGGEQRAARLREAGYRAIKVKVGRGSLPEEAEAVQTIARALGEEVALRLDANRAWSMDTAVEFAEAIRGVNVDYVEEPLVDPERIGDFGSQTWLPVALDETTREVGPDVLRELPVSAVVLKPTLLGGLRKTREWIRAAREHDVTPVLSAAYESGVGLRMLVALAATATDVPAGLSTYDRLAADVLTPRLPLEGPTVDVEAVTASDFQVDRARLTPVPGFS